MSISFRRYEVIDPGGARQQVVRSPAYRVYQVTLAMGVSRHAAIQPSSSTKQSETTQVSSSTEKTKEAPQRESIKSMGPVDQLFTAHLQRVEHHFAQFSTKALRKLNLRSGAIGALSMIIDNPGGSQNDIVMHTTFDKSAVNAIVNNLVEVGWVVRNRAGSDRRRYELFATPEGVQNFDKYLEQIRNREQRLLANLSPEAQRELVGLLDQLFLSCLAAEAP
jgi:DNA-binding MarR family transcriptional regulator